MICKKCKQLQDLSICGQAFTGYKCESCNKSRNHHNTNTPKICEACSSKFWVCQYCECSIQYERDERLIRITNLITKIEEQDKILEEENNE